jgi:drug/metabolite transporter (DMT)-like permease
VEIPTATILSVIFLGNVFTVQDLIGFVLIASTIFLLQKA